MQGLQVGHFLSSVAAPVAGLAGLMASGEALLGAVGGRLEERLARLPLPGWASMYLLAVVLGAASVFVGNDTVLVVALPLFVMLGCGSTGPLG